MDMRLSQRTTMAWRPDSLDCFSPRRTFVQVSPTEFYDVMGLTPRATAEQIKTTYFKLSKIYHPDVCKDPGGVEKFVLISKAYEVREGRVVVEMLCWYALGCYLFNMKQ